MVLLLIAIDVLCLIIALLAAHALRFGFLPDTDYMTGMLVAVIAWPVPFFALGLYGRQHLSVPEEFRRTTAAVGIGIVLLVVGTFWLDLYLSRSWMALTFLIALILKLTSRLTVRTIAMGRAPSSTGLTSGR
jgi:FlaA1/EpsC-like NDP-sugar epimerase